MPRFIAERHFFFPSWGGLLREMSFDVSSVWSLRTRANHQTSKISLLGKNE